MAFEILLTHQDYGSQNRFHPSGFRNRFPSTGFGVLKGQTMGHDEVVWPVSPRLHARIRLSKLVLHSSTMLPARYALI